MDIFGTEAQAPQGAQGNYVGDYTTGAANQQAARKQQEDFLRALQTQAAGGGAVQDAAQAQLQEGLNRGNASIASTLASNRGLSPATAAYLASNAQGAQAQNAAAGAAATRASLANAAMGQVGQTLQGVRQQDLTGANVGAQYGSAQNALNEKAYEDWAQRKDAAAKAGMGAITGLVSGIGTSIIPGASALKGLFGGAAKQAHGGDVLANQAAEEGQEHPWLTPAQAVRVAHDHGYAHGGGIDSEANDTVPTMLSPGERVIPKSISHDPEQSAEFIKALNAMDGHGSEEPKRDSEGFLKALQAKNAELETKVQHLTAALSRR